MWTCPLVFCDFEKFAQKCLFVFAAADFLARVPFMFHQLAFAEWRMEYIPRKSGSSRATRCISFFAFPPDPPCVSLAAGQLSMPLLSCGQLSMPLLSCRLQPDHSCLCMAFHNLSSVRVSILFLGFSCSTSRWCGQPTCLLFTLPALLHLATWCIPCHTAAMHRNPLFSVLRTLSAAGSGSFAGGSPEPVALVRSLQTALLGQ